MALTQLDNSDFYIDHSKISGKTPVKANGTETKWPFTVFCDGTPYRLEYDTEAAADIAWATFT